jgi:hypothetical protein
MARTTDRNTFKREAERTLPYHVDIPVPGGGLGRRLTDMLYWCRTHVASGGWAEHGHSKKRKSKVSLYFSRFYFASEADADTFRKLWASD